MSEYKEIKEFIQAGKCRIYEELEELDKEIDKFNDELKAKKGMSNMLAKIFVERGQSIHYHGECYKMFSNFTTPNGDECELYAEVKIPKKPAKEHYYMEDKSIDVRPFFKENGEFDYRKFFRFAEHDLIAELVKQAGEWRSCVDWSELYSKKTHRRIEV